MSHGGDKRKVAFSSYFAPFILEKGGKIRENVTFFNKNEKSYENIWWNQILFVPLHSLKRNKPFTIKEFLLAS